MNGENSHARCCTIEDFPLQNSTLPYVGKVAGSFRVRGGTWTMYIDLSQSLSLFL
jgi:hypothetical protein